MRAKLCLLACGLAVWSGCQQHRPGTPRNASNPQPPALEQAAPAGTPRQQPSAEQPAPQLPPVPPVKPLQAEDVPQRLADHIPTAEQPPQYKANFGYTPNPEKTKEFLRGLDKPTLPEANPQLFEPDPQPPKTRRQQLNPSAPRGPPRADPPVLLYPALYAVRPGWQVGAQGIGDCVSWGWAHACDIALAVDYTLGHTGQWKSAATEAIYGGSRVEGRGVAEGSGGWGDGSYGAAAAAWVHTKGGVVYRQPFDALGYDLSKYSKDRAKQWGNWGCGGQGDKGRLDKVATEHPVLQVALVRSFEEAAAAIKSGYPVPVCSGQGFTNSRDKDGFAAASGSWAHCMCFIGVRFDRPGLLCLNSWGTKWISGPKWPAKSDSGSGPPEQPDGSFWVDRATVNRMLSGGDSFAVSRIKGFPKRKLKHAEGW